MSSLSKRSRSSNAKQSDQGELVPLNPLAFGSAPFGERERTRLLAWLGEAGWPRWHMNVAELEGYLVALIAWPVGISAGAWLPPIWGERGWKVAAKISERAQYEEFVVLIFGFLQELDRELTRDSSRFEASVLRNTAPHEQDAAITAWAKGFTAALALGSQGLKGRSADAGAAVATIATCGSSPAKLALYAQPVEAVVNAVRLLMSQRTSRGPLGPLDPGALASGSKVGASHRHHAR